MRNLLQMNKPMHASRESNLESLRSYIADGNYGPGDRLPAERELIGALGMTRASLRRALDALEQEGLIWRHVGKGTFLASHGDKQQVNWVENVSHQLTPVKMMRARYSIEPAIAREAAMNASTEAIERISRAIEGSEAATDWESYEAFDDEFHHAVSAASDNLLLAALYDQLSQVQRAVAWKNVVRETERPSTSHTSFAEHRRIARAIENHDPASAHEAMRRHIGSVSARLFGEI